MTVILCGYKGCGKTTIGKMFADCYGLDFIDTDDMVLKANKNNKKSYPTIEETYKNLGELLFRKLEAKVISQIYNVENTVIATGGGAVLNSLNVNHLKSQGEMIYLYVDPAYLYDKALETGRLPGFIDKTNQEADFKRYIDSRNGIYHMVSDHIIDITNKTNEEAVEMINECRLIYA